MYGARGAYFGGKAPNGCGVRTSRQCAAAHSTWFDACVVDTSASGKKENHSGGAGIHVCSSGSSHPVLHRLHSGSALIVPRRLSGVFVTLLLETLGNTENSSQEFTIYLFL
ncbi:unnamed protein product [Pleuronectes platessa]|uniref:Uncharacterized protein n=1 Tax=Pleuronectes platessa TaxID=8262 RepID=A0A9N7V744_PLEPL|nr:unnamed protein product [Pleuronectes platessa]